MIINELSQRATKSELVSGLAQKSNVDHNHDSKYATKTELTTGLASKSDTNHNHDEVYMKKDEVPSIDLSNYVKLHSRYYFKYQYTYKSYTFSHYYNLQNPLTLENIYDIFKRICEDKKYINYSGFIFFTLSISKTYNNVSYEALFALNTWYHDSSHNIIQIGIFFQDKTIYNGTVSISGSNLIVGTSTTDCSSFEISVYFNMLESGYLENSY